jgi:hypothetical protein
MFLDVTSKENNKITEQNNVLVQDLSYNCGRRLKVPIQEAICLSGNVPTGHIVDFTAHTAAICIIATALRFTLYGLR